MRLKFTGQNVSFNCNTDYSGDLVIIEHKTGNQVKVPFEDMKNFIKNLIVDEIINRLENKRFEFTTDELLTLRIKLTELEENE